MLAPVFSAAGMTAAPLLAATAVLFLSVEAVRQLLVDDGYHEAGQKIAASRRASGADDDGPRKSPL